MRKIFLTLALIVGFVPMINAQWTSPGDGVYYFLKELVGISNGTVTQEQGDFFINADLTISENDVLVIHDDVLNIIVRDALITIKGSMVCDNNMQVNVKGEPSFRFLFENATNCNIKNIDFSQGSGLKLISSGVSFENCSFMNQNTEVNNAAVNFFMCSPVFENCTFIANEGAAISSAANNQGSPKILNCTFERNVTSNTNMPQINLGPGSMFDSIYIVGNTIIGGSNMSGGIAVADLMGTGSTTVLLKDNVVRNNRYGYNQQGNSISSLIVGNEFVDNNLETNPMYGGSGISIYGGSTNCKAKLRNNKITGNLWGITAINLNDIDMGTENDWGYNMIYENSNNGILYELYNNSSCDIMAVGNWWGTVDEQKVEELIVHKNDDPSLGLVTFLPIWKDDDVNEVAALNAVIAPNPVSNGILIVTLAEAISAEVSVYDLFGRKLKSQIIENEINTINVESLKSGVYFVEVRNGDSKTVQKVVIE